jgi:hypothetical protein
MKLSMFNLNSGAWEDAPYPYPHTIAKAMFPEHTFTIVGVDPEHTTEEELMSGLPEGDCTHQHRRPSRGLCRLTDHPRSTRPVEQG